MAATKIATTPDKVYWIPIAVASPLKVTGGGLVELAQPAPRPDLQAWIAAVGVVMFFAEVKVAKVEVPTETLVIGVLVVNETRVEIVLDIEVLPQLDSQPLVMMVDVRRVVVEITIEVVGGVKIGVVLITVGVVVVLVVQEEVVVLVVVE